MKTIPLVVGLILSFATVGRADPLAERIVQFCQDHEKKQVGDGSCYALAAKALEAAGGKPNFSYADRPAKGDYVWGKLIMIQEATAAGIKRTGMGGDIQPGDIIQFRDTQWEGKGAGGKGTYSLTFDHHTAIVEAVEGGGIQLNIYHQNFRGKMFVIESILILNDLKKGWIRVYRPVPKL